MLGGDLSVELITRFSIRDWRQGASDPAAVLDFCERFGLPGVSICQNLHAKVYVADRDYAVVTSANLTWRGFHENVELGVALEGEPAAQARRTIIEEAGGAQNMVSTVNLREWVERAQAAGVADNEDDADSDDEDLQDELSIWLTGRLPTDDNYQDFVVWLNDNRQLPRAGEYLDSVQGVNEHHGHARMTFCGAFFYFSRNLDSVGVVVEAAVARPRGVLPIADAPLPYEQWNGFLARNLHVENSTFAMGSLSGSLPPSLGGTRLGGGGWSPTFKRVFPLVARFFQDRLNL